MLDMILPASKHDHEHNAAHPVPAPVCNGSLFVQMPLSIVGSLLRRQTPPLSLPQATTASEHDVGASTPDATIPQKQLMPAADEPFHASPAPSRPASLSSSTGTDDRSKKLAPRSKTSYLCARPPKPPGCKLRIRPKVLLQLHQVIPSQRPKPIYEVIPFSLLPPRSTRRLARTFNTSQRLGPLDLLIVTAEAYDSKDVDTKSDTDRWSSREVIGVICPAKSERERTEICMDDGFSRWEVTHMANGGLEFNTTDDHGLTLKARWVPKAPHARRVSGMSSSSQLSPTFPAAQEDNKYTFSTISPTSRRHPIIATMTQARIDIMDSYTMPSATTPLTPGLTQSPALTPASITAESFMDVSTSRMPIDTDDALRRFIVVSGIWVSQWSQLNFANSASPSMDTSSVRPPNKRTMSMSFIDSPRSTSPASTVDESHRSFPKMLRTSTERLPRCMSFTDLSRSSSASPVNKTRARRANSTGNTNLHSMSGSMRKRYGLAFEGETVPESEEERQEKRSAELLRMKELAIPTTLERISSELSESIPSPTVIPPSSDGSKSPIPILAGPIFSPVIPDPDRTRKTQSAYNPVVTAGMWDSGVSEGPGLKSRPTSMFILNEKKRKQEKKRERSRTRADNDKGVPMKRHEWHKFKTSLKGFFKRDKA